MPFWRRRIALHPAIVARYNDRRFHGVPAADTTTKQLLEQFFFPLDHLVNFNKVYGQGGFYSLHCGIPHGNHVGVREVLRAISEARAGSMAAVLKPMGAPGEGMLSFPLKGYALAVDLPRRRGTEALYGELEHLILQHGGRIYTAKDALMSAQGYARMFPELENFKRLLRQVDPGGRLQSDMSRRLAISPVTHQAGSGRALTHRPVGDPAHGRAIKARRASCCCECVDARPEPRHAPTR